MKESILKERIEKTRQKLVANTIGMAEDYYNLVMVYGLSSNQDKAYKKTVEFLKIVKSEVDIGTIKTEEEIAQILSKLGLTKEDAWKSYNVFLRIAK